MTYVLRERVKNRYYCKDHNKIIEFDTIDEARYFLNGFFEYAMAKAMSMIQDEGPGIIEEVQQVIQFTSIDEKPECNCEFINFKDISGR